MTYNIYTIRQGGEAGSYFRIGAYELTDCGTESELATEAEFEPLAELMQADGWGALALVEDDQRIIRISEPRS